MSVIGDKFLLDAAKILAEERDDRVRTSAKLQVALEGLSLQLQSTLQASMSQILCASFNLDCEWLRCCWLTKACD